MSFGSIAVVTVYFVVVTAILLHGLVVLWPPDRRADEREELVERVALRLAEDSAARRGEEEAAAPVPLDAPTDEDSGAEDASPPPPATPAAAAAAGGVEGGTALAEERGTDASGRSERSPAPVDQDEGSNGCAALEARIRFFGLARDFCLYPEERLFLIVLFTGGLGGLLHALRSFYWYLGNRRLVVSWLGFYLTLPLAGALMAFVFYLVIRGGFTPSGSGVDETNPFGFAALAVLVGLFTDQAARRLKEVAETVFTRAAKGADHADGPMVKTIAMVTGSAGRQVEIIGSGFGDETSVLIAGKKARVLKVGATQIVVEVPEDVQPGEVEVEVVRAGGERAMGRFQYRPRIE